MQGSCAGLEVSGGRGKAFPQAIEVGGSMRTQEARQVVDLAGWVVAPGRSPVAGIVVGVSRRRVLDLR